MAFLPFFDAKNFVHVLPKREKNMFKKAIAGVLSFALIGAFSAPLSVYGDPAAELSSEELIFAEEEETEEEIYVEEETIEDVFTTETESAGENFFDGESAFSDGEDAFSDTEETSFEKTLEVTEGEDITGKLNAALLEMKDKATDSQMCKVIIPPGNYVITGTICTYSNIHLYAQGAVIKKMSPGKHLMLRLGNTEESAGGYEGYRNIVIEGGTWDANYETVPDKEADGGFVCFRIGHASNVEVKDVTFLNNLKSHFLELGGVKNAKVTGCTFRGYWKGFTGGGQETIQLDACRDYIMPNYLPYDGAVCEDIYIEGNTFEDVFAGVGSHSMVFNRPYRNIVIRGNTFRDIAKRAVWCLNYVDSVVENNKMINVGTGVYVRSLYKGNTHLPDGEEVTNAGNQYESDIVVSNNEIILNTPKVIGTGLWKSFGIGIVGEKSAAAPNGVPDGNYPARGITIKENRISGPGNGIRLTFAEKCKVSDNIIELAPTEEFNNCGMILGAGSSNTISGNKIKGSKGNAIYIYRGSSDYAEPSVGNILTKNTITDCMDDGIVAGTGSDSTKIEKNTVKNLGAEGIVAYSNSKTLISGNTVSGCKKDGIYVSSVKSAQITGNKVSGNTVDGIKSEGKNTGLSVKKNNTSKNSGAGMCLSGANGAVVSQNEIASNKNNGISIRKSMDVVISKNTLKSNKGYAVIGTDSSIKTYSGNTLKGNGHTDTIYAINTSLPYSVSSKKIKTR